MSNQIIVPSLGESITEATVSKWLKQVGEQVDSDEPLVELETDKVNVEVPAPLAGILSSIKVKEGDTVEVGALLGEVNESSSISKRTSKPNPIESNKQPYTTPKKSKKKKITKPVIKQIHIKETNDFSEILSDVEMYFSVSKHIILDCYSKYSKGGTGGKFNWEKYKSIIEMDDIFVAGGLNPNNIGNLMENFSPWGLDVSSGVETNGEKNALKITEFIKIANS